MPWEVAIRLFCSALLLLLCACGGDETPAANGSGGPPPGQGPPPAVPVSVATVHWRTIAAATELPGRVTAFRTAAIRPQVSGIIEKRLFEEGAVVQAGQQLYQIDDRRYKADHALAAAQLRKARASLGSVSALAKRYRELVKVNAISKQEYDNAVANLNAARAEVAIARANLEQAKVNLDYTQVYAPITGHISTSLVTEGALVTAQQESPLATVRQLDPVYVDLAQSSEEAVRLRSQLTRGRIAGAVRGEVPVTLTISGFPEPYPLPGRLDVAGMAVDPSTGAIELRAVFPNPDTLLLPGLFVRARVDHVGETRVLLVPQPAVQRDESGEAFVWRVAPGDTVERVPIETGASWKTAWVVKRGLAEGDRVVVEGTQRLRPGAKVEPTDVEPVARR